MSHNIDNEQEFLEDFHREVYVKTYLRGILRTVVRERGDIVFFSSHDTYEQACHVHEAIAKALYTNKLTKSRNFF